MNRLLPAGVCKADYVMLLFVNLSIVMKLVVASCQMLTYSVSVLVFILERCHLYFIFCTSVRLTCGFPVMLF
jgi:hypothetical protein